ncbi:MAG: methionyl-tRNA formyltransferase [Chloroflexota bacterium]
MDRDARPVTRIVFMGTPDFAVPALRALLDTSHFEVAGVVTQPDRPAGRGQRVQMSPVKQVALRASLPVIQPLQAHEPAALDQLHAWTPDFLVVVAFGQILRQPVLDLPRIAPINVHASLLPRWRGAAPIQAAIRAGDRCTGITTMIMDAGLDSGPILLQDSIPIDPAETGQTLHDKLAPLGAQLLLHTLEWLLSGSISPHPQPDNSALITHAPQLRREDGALDWSASAIAIDRHVRAFTPWPGTFTTWNGRRLKVLAGFPSTANLGLAPGQVASTDGTPLDGLGPLAVGTGSGVYLPLRLQLEGRQALSAEAFRNGAPDFVGSRLG